MFPRFGFSFENAPISAKCSTAVASCSYGVSVVAIHEKRVGEY